MNKFIVLIDSSTKRSAKTSKYGNSTIAWAGWWNKIDGLPSRAEAIFIGHEGPNKSFYDGIIRILQSCFHLCRVGDKLEIYGDCLLVINHINAQKHSGKELLPFYNQVIKLKEDYRCPVEFFYINRNNKIYTKIDNLAKQARGFFINALKNL